MGRRLPVWPVLRQLRGTDRLGLAQAAQSSRSAGRARLAARQAEQIEP